MQYFEVAQIACFNPAERQAYEDSLKYYRDLKNVTDTAWEEGREDGLAEGREEGREEGKQEEKREIARNLLDVLDNTTIALKTGLSAEEVQCLRERV